MNLFSSKPELDVKFLPNIKMIICGIFNGDEYTYKHKMIVIDKRLHSVRCTHDTQRPAIKQLSDIVKPDEHEEAELQLVHMYLNGQRYKATRCVICGRIYWTDC